MLILLSPVQNILIAIGIVAAVGIVLGLMIVLADKLLKTGVDEKEAQTASVTGPEHEEGEKKAAFVRCSGTCDKTERKYNYYGIADCREAALVPGQGDKVCSFGCLGFGSCVRECESDAIHIINGVAVVDEKKCTACGKCIKACPKNLIGFVPVKNVKKVACSSQDKGKDVRFACRTGCIGCMICIKQCEAGAIVVENDLACIDHSKCTGCGRCAESCPQHVIVS